MIGAVPYQDCVQPYPLLCSVKPLVLKLLLTDRANIVDATGGFWNRNVFRNRGNLGLLFGRRLRLRDVVYVDDFSRPKPILDSTLVHYTHIPRQKVDLPVGQRTNYGAFLSSLPRHCAVSP